MIFEPRTRKDRLFLWLLVFLSCILIGLLNFGIIHTNELAERRMGYDFRKPLLYELTGPAQFSSCCREYWGFGIAFRWSRPFGCAVFRYI